jgi:2-polyprenyl-3-methyl-5-hydroxy-6-metoxy-1,4-benzoquinol methylase
MNMENEVTKFGWISANEEAHQQYTIPAIMALLPRSKPLNIIDVGCGNGYLVNYLFKAGHRVVGIDVAEDGIEIARETYPHLKFQLRSAYEKLDDLLGVPADVIISSEVIEHLYYPQRFLKNMSTALRPGGYLLLTTPYHGYLKNIAISLLNGWDQHHHPEKEGGHIKFFSEKSLRQILTDHRFGNIKFRNAGRLPFFWKSMICRAQKELRYKI